MNKHDVFYYAKLNGVPIYFQPDDNEVVPRNIFCKLLLDIQEFFGYLDFRVTLYHKTIKREEIKKL